MGAVNILLFWQCCGLHGCRDGLYESTRHWVLGKIGSLFVHLHRL